jgi:hypothetical protein
LQVTHSTGIFFLVRQIVYPSEEGKPFLSRSGAEEEGVVRRIRRLTEKTSATRRYFSNCGELKEKFSVNSLRNQENMPFSED